MIEIKKGKEPNKLLWYRKQKGASYRDMDRDVKDELLEKLLQEQGHLCAYCMRRIPEERALPVGIPNVTIEHWYPQNPDNEEDVGQDLDYRNMFAVCSGNRGCGEERGLTCDAARKNTPIKVNPCDANTLHGITYTSKGRIQSSDPDVNRDLNDVLNLNCEAVSLPENRKRALDELIKDVNKNHATGDISIYCKRKLKQIQAIEDKKIPFEGILIDWLSKRCR